MMAIIDMYFWVKYVFVPTNMSNFYFSPSKKFRQLLNPQKISILTFGPSFKVNSYV